MKSQKGITLIMVIITILLLLIIAGLSINSGINTFGKSKVLKFESYMRLIQKNVDLILDEGTDFTTLGSALTIEQQNSLKNIIDSNDVYIETDDETNANIRYFSSDDIENIFDIPDVNDEIVVNFETREIISLKGVEKDSVMHYVINSLY